MSTLSKERLQERSNRAARIEATLRTTGWQEIQKIIVEEFNENIDKALKKDDPEARGAVNALKRITERISSDLQIGKVALDEYRKKYLNTQTPNGE